MSRGRKRFWFYFSFLGVASLLAKKKYKLRSSIYIYVSAGLIFQQLIYGLLGTSPEMTLPLQAQHSVLPRIGSTVASSLFERGLKEQRPHEKFQSVHTAAMGIIPGSRHILFEFFPPLVNGEPTEWRSIWKGARSDQIEKMALKKEACKIYFLFMKLIQLLHKVSHLSLDNWNPLWVVRAVPFLYNPGSAIVDAKEKGGCVYIALFLSPVIYLSSKEGMGRPLLISSSIYGLPASHLVVPIQPK